MNLNDSKLGARFRRIILIIIITSAAKEGPAGRSAECAFSIFSKVMSKEISYEGAVSLTPMAICRAFIRHCPPAGAGQSRLDCVCINAPFKTLQKKKE